MKSVVTLSMKICTVVLLCAVVSFMYINHSATNALGQQEALMKEMEVLKKKYAACGSNYACQQKVMQEMNALIQQMAQPVPSAAVANGQGEPCAGYRQPGMSCLPVTVTVSDIMREEGYDVITDGIIRRHNYDNERYTKSYLVFSYKAKAQGELVYNKDFSKFTLVAIGTPATTQISALNGYRQWTDRNNHLKRRDYHLGQSTIRRPFKFSIWYPKDGVRLTNIHFDPVMVETADDWMSTVEGSQITDNTYNYGLKKEFIVTPQKIKQFIKARGFKETFQWRSTQPNGKDWVDYQVTVAVQIGEGCDAKLSIVKPAKNKTNFCYSKATPGVLTLNLEATATPAKYEKDIKWTAPQIAGSTRTDSPNPLVGPKVKVTYSGLPKKNSEFGGKTIVAKLDVAGCKAKDEVEINVFFPRDATNNPDGKDPNWFYYWKQTSAATLGSKASYDGFKCTQEGGTGVETLGYFPPKSLPDEYYICDLVKACGEDMKFETVVWTFKPGKKTGELKAVWTDLKTTGIDTFALATLHEAEHYTHLRKWWLGPDGKNPMDKFKRDGLDTDRDDLLDKLEKTKKQGGTCIFKIQIKPTYPSTTKYADDDEELYTQWVAHKKFKPVDKEEDWACPGKQCKIKVKKK